ncbi:hypothetical protein [uncultured Bacteroides sp.]|jgi:hypothetical protein|uniref:hypothetical protein n=1 Tax=uncultured Bacteroides sp. TaxID=162156 RepID=UPI00280AF0C6|nr:hypothetical protein [uncultured Bacteroides sp.]
MKKNYLFGMALMASLAFFSCTNEVIYVHDGESSEQVSDDQIITLQVSNGGDGLTTRAGRPLYSAEAKQSIENVKLWICNDEGSVVFVKEISDWNSDGSKPYTTNGHGRQTTIELTGEDKLAAGTYKIYAVGYSNDSDYDLKNVTDVAEEETFSENIILPVKSEKVSTVNGEEIFAGQLDLTVEAKKGFKTPIILNRQVAGAFAYVKDIPYFDGVKYLKLVASAKNKSLVLGNFNSFDLTGNGSGNEGHVNYVVNGADAANDGNYKYDISKVDLAEWFTTIKDGDSDGLIDVDANWKNGIDSKTDGEKETTFQKGSVFGGDFVIPFAKVDAHQSLTLVLTKEDGTELKSWKVKLAGDVNSAYYWDGSNWTSQTSGETVNNYSLVRNHLYGIGTRMKDNPGEGTDPEPDPDPEDPEDKPESLNNKQELILKVNDNWEVIHGMELE